MAARPKANRACWLGWLVLLMLTVSLEGGLVSVSASTKAINAIATYTWIISFNAGTPYHPLTLNFPSQLTLYPNSTPTINTLNQTFTLVANALTITSPLTSPTVTIVVANVRNPPSAISTFSFSYYN